MPKKKKWGRHMAMRTFHQETRPGGSPRKGWLKSKPACEDQASAGWWEDMEWHGEHSKPEEWHPLHTMVVSVSKEHVCACWCVFCTWINLCVYTVWVGVLGTPHYRWTQRLWGTGRWQRGQNLSSILWTVRMMLLHSSPHSPTLPMPLSVRFLWGVVYVLIKSKNLLM